MESFTDYIDAQKHIPPDILEHLRGLIPHCGLPEHEETMKKLVEAWLLKKAAFQKTAEHSRMRKDSLLRTDDGRGGLVLTMSGSLLMVGPLAEGVREIRYTGIGMRTDVPESLEEPEARLAANIECGKPVRFAGGRLQKTSAVMDLAVMAEEKSGQEQTALLRKADGKIKADFRRLNAEALEKPAAAKGLRQRDDLFTRWIVIQWFLLGGLEKHVFMARAKLLWLELFTGVYDAVGAKKPAGPEQDGLFLDFTNRLFAKFCDDYKWFESEHKNFDIGLMKALEELPDYPAYRDFRDQFCKGL